MATILNYVKDVLGVPGSGFDTELLGFINSATNDMSLIGVSEFDHPFVIDQYTVFPVFTNTNTLNYVKAYLTGKVRLGYDPPANTAIKDVIEKNSIQTLDKLRHVVYMASLEV